MLTRGVRHNSKTIKGGFEGLRRLETDGGFVQTARVQMVVLHLDVHFLERHPSSLHSNKIVPKNVSRLPRKKNTQKGETDDL